MNNIKKMIMGFGAVAMIVSFSAFKDISKTLSVPKAVKAGAITADYLVQPVANQYREFGLTGSPSPSNCEDPAVRQCFYHVTPDGKANIPAEPVDGYTATQIQTYLDNEWIELASGSDAALYGGPF